MFNSKSLRTVVVIISLMFFAIAAKAAEIAAKPSGDKLLTMIPADSLFCVRVNNLDQTLNQIDQFLTGVSPMGVSMLVRAQFAKMLGGPDLKGVNMNGSFAVFAALAPGESVGEEFISLFVPVSDYKQFIDGNPNISPPDANGVSKITSGPILMQVDNFALVKWQNSYDKLVSTAKSLSAARAKGLDSVLSPDEAKQADTEPVWAYGNVQLASNIFGSALLGKIEEMKKMMESVNAKGQRPMGNTAAIMDMYAGILEKLMKETKSLDITVSAKPNVLNVTSVLSAMPGTEMADAFTQDAAVKENTLMGYLQNGAVMNVSGKAFGIHNAKLMGVFATTMAKDMNALDVAKIKSFASDVATVFGGNEAMTFSVDPNNKPPFSMTFVIEVGDKDRFNKVIEEGMELFNTGGFAAFYKSLGMETRFTIKRDVGSYKDVSIDSARFAIKSTEPNSPQGQIINAMYGDGIEYRWAIVGGRYVCVVGGDVDSAVRRLIDQEKAGSPKQLASEMKEALALLPAADKADFVATYNLLRAMKMVTAFMPLPMFQMDIPTKSNIVFAGRISNGRMAVEMALPKEHLMEIVGFFQKMQQQQKEIMKQQRSPISPDIIGQEQ